MTDYLLRGRSLAAERIAFRDDSHAFTYAEVDSMTREAASGMIDLIGPGRSFRAAILSPNDSRAFIALIAAVRAGGAWVPVNARNPVSVSASYLAAVGCDVLLFHSDLAAEAQQLAQRVPSIRYLVCVDDRPASGQHGLSDLRARGANRPAEDLGADPDRIMAVYPTGGTTGLSKAAIWTDWVWQAATTAFWTSMPVRRPPTHLVVAPMKHAAGGVALWMMAQGSTNVMCRSSDPRDVLEAIQEHRVTHLFVPRRCCT
ncbi:class I adenylate-forming enzyme family protein [Nocardioides sp. AE5]|uniref:class I adenylate-forming enzyme family protein n=1 Tax=Nocardioides sp. AE5 TaxID=2962573 RepID=UPI002881DE44|nr:class I adenylate-forming enzyme family protein [Nocardioides sp. AE5]MDT0203176.1 class I adenylate-forming enzyme family protein [Nocardioides sp. AE5]